MKDQQCIDFLQWALPKLKMRWRGFRKVRKQVCKRINKRLNELELQTIEEYKYYLEKNTHEWNKLDNLCRITISRFYRNSKIFEKIGIELLPLLYKYKDKIRCWSIGCASGEEPYSISIIFHNLIKTLSPFKEIEIVATDADPNMLERAEKACYQEATIKELPCHWKNNCFTRNNSEYCLKQMFKEPIDFLKQDIRHREPDGTFDLILCRNLVATYFDTDLQKNVFKKITDKLNPGGYLIIGKNEKTEALPSDLKLYNQHLRIFQK